MTSFPKKIVALIALAITLALVGVAGAQTKDDPLPDPTKEEKTDYDKSGQNPHHEPMQVAPAEPATLEHAAPEHAKTGAHAEHATGEHAAGGHHGPDPINWTDTSNKKQPPYLALIINFAILVFIYYRFGKKPIADGLKKRRENVAKQIEEAARIKQEAAARAKKYQSQLEHLDEEAAQTKAAIHTTGQADRDRVLREADEKAGRMERDADALLDAERRQTKRVLYEEAVEGAVKRAEELLRTKLTQADHERLAEEFLTQLASQKAAPARGTGAGSAVAPPMQKVGDS